MPPAGGVWVAPPSAWNCPVSVPPCKSMPGCAPVRLELPGCRQAGVAAPGGLWKRGGCPAHPSARFNSDRSAHRCPGRVFTTVREVRRQSCGRRQPVVDWLYCLTFSPGLAVEPAGLAWGTRNRIVPAARSGGGLRPLHNPGRRLGQSRVQCDAHCGQPVAGVLARGWARQPRGLWARGQRAAGAENWSRRRGRLPRRRWAWVAGPVSSAPRLRLRLSATAFVRRRCTWRRRRRSRWSPAA